MRLVMFGTGPFAAPTFRALYETAHQVVGLVTQPSRVVRGKVVAADTPLRSEAQKRGTPILDPENVNLPEAQAKLAALAADLFVVADYGQILSAETLALAARGAINLHGSLLPKYRGAAPINWAIYHGETVSGVSVIHMTPRIDAGPVLAQDSTPIDPDETAVDLETRLAALGAPLICRTIDAIEAGTTTALPQDMSQVTGARRLRKTDGAIDWSRSAQQIKNQIRALDPWPRTSTYWHRASAPPLRLIVGRVDVTTASVETTQDTPNAPGTVLVANKDELIIVTGNGTIAIRQLQPEGRQMMATAEFLRGHTVREGDRFGF